MRVAIRTWRLRDANITVDLDADGYVYIGTPLVHIGRVEKSHRTYSPPIHRGSPIARYHKRVKCWRASPSIASMTFKTRQEALAYLVERHQKTAVDA